MVGVDILASRDEANYEAFVNAHPHGTLFYSLQYRDLLTQLLPDTCAVYLLAKHDGRVLGVLPAFIKKGRAGNVINSLPFYGSHGGALTMPGSPYTLNVTLALIRQFHQIAASEQCLSSTIVSPLFADDADLYERETCYDYRDSRIGQVTKLPERGADLEERLMQTFHSKTRNMVRKAYKSGMQCFHSNTDEALEFLARLHRQNITGKGGIPKEWGFFSLVPKVFTYERDYRVYVATKDGEKIAALLLFYHGKTVEYFTPAVVEEHRALQPLSLLIFEAMKEAAREGCRYWNWGGTWQTQEGVYRFKKGWGATDHMYYYYIKKHRDITPLLELGKMDVLDAYKYFYVIPFSVFE